MKYEILLKQKRWPFSISDKTNKATDKINILSFFFANMHLNAQKKTSNNFFL